MLFRSGTQGLGGFQETEQLPFFEKITKYQAQVTRPDRLAEFTGRCFDLALAERGPTQLNIPRDYFYGSFEDEIYKTPDIARGAGPRDSLEQTARLLAEARYPVILAGGGVSMGRAVDETKALAEYLSTLD